MEDLKHTYGVPVTYQRAGAEDVVGYVWDEVQVRKVALCATWTTCVRDSDVRPVDSVSLVSLRLLPGRPV